jgi:anti-sigma factor RsiW
LEKAPLERLRDVNENRKARAMKHKCLSDDQVAAYVDGVIAPDLRRRIEEHLDRCSLCLNNVSELKQLVTSDATLGASLPAAALARAESIIADRLADRADALPELDVILALKSGVCKILETTGRLLAPGRMAPVTVRRGDRPAPTPKVAKSMSGYLVTLEAVAAEGAVQPRITIVEEASSATPDGTRAKLYAAGSSETKYSRAGRITFSPVKPGDYTIEIEDVGRIRLAVQ